MLWPWHLRRAAWLLSLCLLAQCHPHTAAPLFLGEAAHPGEALHQAQNEPANEIQVRSLPEAGPGTPKHQEGPDDLFQDVDPKALAAVLLQALQAKPEKPHEERRDPEPNEERVQSETKSASVERPEEPAGARDFSQQEMEGLKAMLEELQHYSPTARREEPPQERQAPARPRGDPEEEEEDDEDVLKELEEYGQLRVTTKRKAPPSEPWAGARKLRQQQHLEHQLLQRRYEELAESRRQAEEARRAAAEEERLADMASDLLLQYLLKDGEAEEEEQEEGPGANGQEEAAGGKGRSSLLFEDEEGNVAEDKRSNEALPEQEDEDDIDPNTIDRLIELSSKLHLPADDVIDIINDVEKKKGAPEPSPKSKTPATALQEKPKKKTPPPSPPYHQEARPVPKPRYPPPAAYQPPFRHLPKEDEAAWNEVLRGDEYPAPKWYRGQPSNKISNYISPRTVQPPAYHRNRHLPGPLVPRDKYYDEDDEDSRAHDEELENYIERVLRKRPKALFP